MKQKNVLIFLFIALLALSFSINGQASQWVSAMPINFTVPTRTPEVPPTQPPPPTQDPGGGSDSTPVPAVTNTAVPQQSPTAVIFAPTPIGGYLATAEPCSTSPTITAQALSNVRAGPGTAYDVIGELVFIEVRPVTGRAADVVWWQISLADGRFGWIANSVVQFNGNHSVVPIVDAPLINGVAPTPGIPWTPAIAADCFIEPTWTAVPPTPIGAEPTAESNRSEPTPTELSPTETTTAAVEGSAEPTTETEALAAVPLITDQDNQSPPQQDQSLIATAAPLNQPIATPPSSNVIFMGAGGILFLLIVGLVLMRRPSENEA